MVVVVLLGCLILTTPVLYFLIVSLNNDAPPINWPFIGMTPTLALNFHRLYDKVAQVLEKSNGTLTYRKFWLGNISFLSTSDPENVRHIMNTNHSTYIKGSDWKEQFDIFGDSLFNSDSDDWKYKRNINRGFLHSRQFHESITLRLIPRLIETAVVPLLDHVAKQGLLVNLQDLFRRHSHDLSTIVVTGFNPKSLSIGFPKVPFSTAMDDAMEAALLRYIMPKTLMKMLKRLQLGSEKKLSDAKELFDETLAKYISMHREQNFNGDGNEYESFNFLNYLTTNESTRLISDKLLRDHALYMMLAFEDTTSTTLTWFFWMLSKNPNVEKKIKEELNGNLQLYSNLEEVNKLVYLHAALCETLRLFPPAPFEFRRPTQSDTLPSGHRVSEKTRIVLCIHAMGRMKSIWGEDCREFKPERWITEEGRIKREPPTKFFSFISGPRICLGKELAFTLMKATAASILVNYDVEVVTGQRVTPVNSIFFHMKNDLMARIKSKQA